jgi:hypothetical protein
MAYGLCLIAYYCLWLCHSCHSSLYCYCSRCRSSYASCRGCACGALLWMCLWWWCIVAPPSPGIFLMTQHLGSLLLLTSPLPVLFSSVAIISCLLFLRTRGGWGDAIDRTAHRGSSRSIARAPSPPSLATLAGLIVRHRVLPARPFN